MSAIALVFQRDGGPVDDRSATTLLSALAHRGIDGSAASSGPGWWLGHLHFWTTPEEVGEQQPLQSASGRYHLAFDGRLDNRQELLTQLGSQDPGPSDAALVLAAIERWGERAIERLLGPFALLAVDSAERRVFLARDALGSRGLHFHLDSHILIAASEAHAVASATGDGPRLDETRLALYCALVEPASGLALFSGVTEVPPAHVLSVAPERFCQRRYWSPPLKITLRHRSDGELAEQYRELLDRSVARTLRTGSDRVALQLSGGLDSTTVAACASRQLAASGRAPLLAFTWSFDRFAECDERRWSREVAARGALELHEVPCDDALPLSDLDRWPLDPDFPEFGIYRAVNMRTLEAARALGARVVLGGFMGDVLFDGPRHWLLDLLREGELRRALAAVGGYRRRFGLRQAVRRLVLSPLLPTWARRARAARWPWLTPHARRLVKDHLAAIRANADNEHGAEQPDRHLAVLGAVNARDESRVYFESLAGVELRHPFRDRGLVEFMLQVPAHQLLEGGTTRPIVRRAFRGVLPSSVLDRSLKTSFLPLLEAALAGKQARPFVEALRPAPEAAWHRFVAPQAVSRQAAGQLTGDRSDHIAWRLFCLQQWCDRLHKMKG